MNKQELISKIKQLDSMSQDERAYLINLINTKKEYGLVWEDKIEGVEEELRIKLPVLKEDKSKTIFNGREFPNHILIEGDNLHSLTVLNFTHDKKFDVIYIDPPYNTGNKDFIYNDQYVDKEDGYRHSKWLAFMHKRLKAAKSLLSENGIIAISIGYQEVHNLVPLCEGLFQSKQVVCVTVQTSGGKPSGGFNYLQEYIIFVTPYDFNPNPLKFSGGTSRSPFEGLTLSTFDKIQRPNQVYPIFIDKKTGGLYGIGKSLANRVKEGIYYDDISSFKYDYSEAPEGTVALWPITSKGKDCVWRLIPSRLLKDWKNGYIKISPNVSSVNPNQYSVQYLPEGVIKKIKSGDLIVVGTENELPTLIFGENKTVGSDIPTIWTEKSFFTTKGSALLKEMFKDEKFPYPKPIDLISEILRATSKKDSLILDFFAGTGTTLHATLELNDEDGGNRQCIIVTNNENNICEEVTYERIKRVINGYVNTKNEEIDGLKSNNLIYYKNEFVSRNKSLKDKKELTTFAAELLCIKEDCFINITDEYVAKNSWISMYKNSTKQFIMIYDDMMIEDSIEIIKKLNINKKNQNLIKVYVFSNGQYPYTEDFEEVLNYITLCALPDAIYKAYQNILPKKTRNYIPTLDNEEIIIEQVNLFNQ